MAVAPDRFDAWNPGLSSEIPRHLWPQITLFAPENATLGYPEARDAADFCGLRPQDMADFRVSRLAVHEVLIRVTADLFVPDGPNYEELGLNLRSMVARILETQVCPRLPELEAALAEVRRDAEAFISETLDREIYPAPVPAPEPAKRSLLQRLLGQKAPPLAAAPPEPMPELRALARWGRMIEKPDGTLETSCLEALHTVVGGIVGRKGRLMADKALIVRLATTRVCNTYGSRSIGALIDPMIRAAARAEGYRLLPYQDQPLVMNVKGASAAGKSTIRPLQRELAERLGVAWENFALVSPDYWRKFLLDYDSLGENYKYAAMLTGFELEVIDRKLDNYMEEKALRSELPHLLIDRFRFDSFEPSTLQQADGRLLSRFGHTVFMFFVITPPVDTVSRAWKRGKETGRYKAVDDLLYHNIEAYTGMPQLFFSFVRTRRQKVHFEFLDNSVPYGQRPRTVAFGWNDKITILDPQTLRNLNAYSRVNVDATRPEDVHNAEDGQGPDILRDCIDMITTVTFADPLTLRILARIRNQSCVYAEKGFLDALSLHEMCPAVPAQRDAKGDDPQLIEDATAKKKFTVGDWGATRS